MNDSEDHSPSGGNSGNKRPADDQPRTRAKRNRYISIAWCVEQLQHEQLADHVAAMSASAARSNATARIRAKGVETCL
jgi:hypothetical protein